MNSLTPNLIRSKKQGATWLEENSSTVFQEWTISQWISAPNLPRCGTVHQHAEAIRERQWGGRIEIYAFAVQIVQEQAKHYYLIYLDVYPVNGRPFYTPHPPVHRSKWQSQWTF